MESSKKESLFWFGLGLLSRQHQTGMQTDFFQKTMDIHSNFLFFVFLKWYQSFFFYTFKYHWMLPQNFQVYLIFFKKQIKAWFLLLYLFWFLFLFFLSFYFEMGSHSGAQTGLEHWIPPTSVSQMAAISDLWHKAHLVLVLEASTCCVTQTGVEPVILLPQASPNAGVASVDHHMELPCISIIHVFARRKKMYFQCEGTESKALNTLDKYYTPKLHPQTMFLFLNHCIIKLNLNYISLK